MNKSYTYQSETEIMHLAEQERAKVIGGFFKNLFKKQKKSYSEIFRDPKKFILLFTFLQNNSNTCAEAWIHGGALVFLKYYLVQLYLYRNI